MFENEVKETKKKVEEFRKNKKNIIIAIDGMTGSGKTTLASILMKEFNCRVFHADDFFLPFELKTEKRLSEPGGNIHYERMKTELIDKLNNTDENYIISYKPFLCSKKDFGEPIEFKYNPISIVEGSYCLHPYLGKYYDLSIFLALDEKTQIERLMKRCPEKIEMFKNKWIPFEAKYHKELHIKEKCDLLFEFK